MKRPVIILGGGGHATVLIETLMCCGVEIAGICDPRIEKGAPGPLGICCLGGEEILSSNSISTTLLVNGLGSTRSTEARRDLFLRFKRDGFRFASVVHPSAVIAKNVTFGEGVQIMAGCVLQPEVILGDNVIVNTGATVDHHCDIGSHSHVAPGVTLSGNVQIGAGSHLGTGAVVVHSVQMGRNSFVRSGAIVVDQIPDGGTASLNQNVEDGKES